MGLRPRWGQRCSAISASGRFKAIPGEFRVEQMPDPNAQGQTLYFVTDSCKSSGDAVHLVSVERPILTSDPDESEGEKYFVTDGTSYWYCDSYPVEMDLQQHGVPLIDLGAQKLHICLDFDGLYLNEQMRRAMDRTLKAPQGQPSGSLAAKVEPTKFMDFGGWDVQAHGVFHIGYGEYPFPRRCKQAIS